MRVEVNPQESLFGGGVAATRLRAVQGRPRLTLALVLRRQVVLDAVQGPVHLLADSTLEQSLLSALNLVATGAYYIYLNIFQDYCHSNLSPSP